jgi:hypothetical protein
MDLRALWRSVGALLRLVLWVIQTVWLGGRALWHFGTVLRGWRQLVSLELTCPRDHRIPALSRWRCSCGADSEGHAFAACPLCGTRPTYVACDQCGLPIRNPLT